MLPRLSIEWCCVAASDPRKFDFEGYWHNERTTGQAWADSDQVSIEVAPGEVLEIPLDTFAHLFSTLMIAAHSRAK